MKGYVVSTGYMGYFPEIGKYLLFATEAEYAEAYREDEENEEN